MRRVAVVSGLGFVRGFGRAKLLNFVRFSGSFG
jgi:hypothetical protein